MSSLFRFSFTATFLYEAAGPEVGLQFPLGLTTYVAPSVVLNSILWPFRYSGFDRLRTDHKLKHVLLSLRGLDLVLRRCYDVLLCETKMFQQGRDRCGCPEAVHSDAVASYAHVP
jgi:hypothetical protein